MQGIDSGLVDIVRDFLTAHQRLRRMLARQRRGDLPFEAVRGLVGDTEESPLYRLKERCHSLFRHSSEAESAPMRREALFDLTIGSLFHEAMKFRENLYQRTAYGPKVRALRSAGNGDSEEIFREFERILEASSVRLDEALHETEALLSHARAQFRHLLKDHDENGLVARYLIEAAPLVEEVFQEELDVFLAGIYGSADAAHALAARSYLASGYFEEASRQLTEALDRREDAGLTRLSSYAEGMSAYLRGDYRAAVESLERWMDTGPGDGDPVLAELAHSAISRVGQLVTNGSAGAEVTTSANALAGRLEAILPG